jgi:uncharacterized cupin superfamily protein
MEISNLNFCVTDWDKVMPTEHLGISGKAIWKTQEFGKIRVRFVDYSPGYIADHWCSRGHIILVLEGELETELEDGRRFTLKPGMTYQVATDAEAHRSLSKVGAKLFIVD